MKQWAMAGVLALLGLASCLADPPKQKSSTGDMGMAGADFAGAPAQAGSPGSDVDSGASGGGSPGSEGGSPGSEGGARDSAGASNVGAGAPGVAGTGNAGNGPAPVCVAGSVSCSDSSTLTTCNGDGTGLAISPCANGCLDTPAAHCAVLTPSAPVLASDLASTTAQAITAASGVTVLNTDTGAISGGLTRDSNLVATHLETINGIGFRQASDGTGVFVFQSLTVPVGATLKLIGSAPVSLVASTNLLIYGLLDGRPMDSSGALCASGSSGPGAAGGGAAGIHGPTFKNGVVGNGPGGGVGGAVAIQGDSGGGGGAGHFKTGGGGGAGCHQGTSSEAGGAGGPAYTSSLRGGSGGGGGGFGVGGGGGGALQLVAGAVLTIGDGSNFGGVNVGGCGGKASGSAVGAGGGGAGGSILLEAPLVQVRPKGTLAANGGGGGGALDGQEGQLSAQASLGSGSSAVSQLAGNGGAGDAPAGTNAQFGCSSTTEGLGGGGSAGTVRILASGGSPAVNTQAVLSPTVASGGALLGSATVN